MTAAIRVARVRVGDWYDEYRQLRHAIFVEEQGWHGLSSASEPGLTLNDPADRRAWFWLARSREGRLVGVVRVVPIQPQCPHEELFARHLANAAVQAMRSRLGSLNSLAVDSHWRRQLCTDDRGRTGTVAALLLRRCLAECPGLGMDAVLATAQTTISVRALMRAGFHVIDAPVRTHLHPSFAMCNVGVVIEHADHAAVALADYFRRCEQDVLGMFVAAAAGTAAIPAAVTA